MIDVRLKRFCKNKTWIDKNKSYDIFKKEVVSTLLKELWSKLHQTHASQEEVVLD